MHRDVIGVLRIALTLLTEVTIHRELFRTNDHMHICTKGKFLLPTFKRESVRSRMRSR